MIRAFYGTPHLLPWLFMGMVMIWTISACTLVKVDFPGDPLSKEELNIRVVTRDFARQFAKSVEETADRILNDTSDPAIQTNALRWKLNAVAEVQDSIFQPIPMLALIDIWTFSVQMVQFFNEGKGRTAFGPHQALAVDAAVRLNGVVEQLSRSVLSGTQYKNYRQFVETTARQMPITNLSFHRESLLSVWARFEGKKEKELLATVGTAPEVLEDFINRFAFYERTIPSRAEWATRLYMLESGMGERIDQQMENLNATSTALASSARQAVTSLSILERRLVRLADDSPEIMDAALTRLSTDLAPMMNQLNTSWNTTIEMLDQINQRWEASLDVLSSERQALVSVYQQERSVFALEVNRIIERGWDQLKSTLTRMSIYLVVFIVLLFGLPFALGFIVGRVTSKTAVKTAGNAQESL